MNKIQSVFQDKCISFAISCENLRRSLNKDFKEYNKADQIARSSSAIGAMYSEALYSESEVDYIHKLSIAQKECSETIYWLKVIFGCKYITEEQYSSLVGDVSELMRYITAVIVSLKKKNSKM